MMSQRRDGVVHEGQKRSAPTFRSDCSDIFDQVMSRGLLGYIYRMNGDSAPEAR